MIYNNVKFKKISLNLRELTVDYDEMTNDENGIIVTNQVKKKCEQICHDDLLAAVRRLVPHFAILSEVRTLPEPYLDGSQPFDETALNKVFGDTCRVSGLSINYSSDAETVIISGLKFTRHSCVCFNAPQVTNTDSQYPYVAELFEAVEHVKSEVFAYLFEGKCAFRQAELFDDSLDATNPGSIEGEAEKPAPKRRGRKPAASLTNSQPLAS